MIYDIVIEVTPGQPPYDCSFVFANNESKAWDDARERARKLSVNARVRSVTHRTSGAQYDWTPVAYADGEVTAVAIIGRGARITLEGQLARELATAIAGLTGLMRTQLFRDIEYRAARDILLERAFNVALARKGEEV